MEKCPLCGSEMVPMRGKAAGKGFHCSKQTWSRAAGQGGCSGVIWSRGNFVRREKVERPSSWPTIAKRTAEQQQIRDFLSLSPDKRGGRLLIVNATAGSGKTTTMADANEAVYNRVGMSAVQNWHECAFNVNAKESLESKVPSLWPNIATINGFGGRLQGYNFRSYKTAKARTIFNALTEHLPRKERPRMGPVKAFCERARDMLIYCDDEGDSAFWSAAIANLCVRFPGLAKKLEKDSAGETVAQYFPAVMVRLMADSKTIDLTEQYARPGLLAVQASGWRLPWHLCERNPTWIDEDISHLASLIRTVRIPQIAGVIVDEAQDLSLSQLVLFLAATWKQGELILVGDDVRNNPGENAFKAGQGIFRWRGAGGGILSLVPRIWQALTGEKVNERSLSVTFRVPPEGVTRAASFCPEMKASKPSGSGEVLENVASADAFQLWLDLPEGETALWLSRKNAPLGFVFMETLKARRKVCLRGGGDFSAQVDLALNDAAGWYDDNGEYKVSLSDCLDKLTAAREGDESADDLACFLLSLGREVLKNPAILTEAQTDGVPLQAVASVGNLKRFVVYFASVSAPRTCSTVYRAKGDEADTVLVDDCESFNSAWNDDAQERNAVCFVALTRQKRRIVIIGTIDPPMATGGKAEAMDGAAGYFAAATAVDAGYGSDNPPPVSEGGAVLVNAPEVVKPRKPRAPRKSKTSNPTLFD